MTIGKEGELPCLADGRKMVLEAAPLLLVIDSAYCFRGFMTEKINDKKTFWFSDLFVVKRRCIYSS